jgi:hypothetical protein
MMMTLFFQKLYTYCENRFTQFQKTLRAIFLYILGSYAFEAIKHSIRRRFSLSRPEPSLVMIRNRVNEKTSSIFERLRLEKEAVRERIVELGERVYTLTPAQKAVLAMVGSLPLIYATYRTYQEYEKLETQGNLATSETFTKDAKPNPWYRDDYVPEEFDTGKLVSSWKGLDFNSVVQKVSKSCSHIDVRFQRDGANKVIKGKMFCVGGQMYVTNKHNLPDLDCNISVVTAPQKNGVSMNFQFFLSREARFEIPEKDLVFFRIRAVPPRADLRGLFVPMSLKEPFEVYF